MGEFRVPAPHLLNVGNLTQQRLWLNVTSSTAALHVAGRGGVIFEGVLGPVPTVTPQGATGASTWGYFIVPFDDTGRIARTQPLVLINNGNAALSGANFNRITWPAAAGVEFYLIGRISPSGVTTERIAIIQDDGSPSYQLDDTGLPNLQSPMLANLPAPLTLVSANAFEMRGTDAIFDALADRRVVTHKNVSGSYWLGVQIATDPLPGAYFITRDSAFFAVGTGFDFSVDPNDGYVVVRGLRMLAPLAAGWMLVSQADGTFKPYQITGAGAPTVDDVANTISFP